MKLSGTIACDYGTLYHVVTDYSIQVDNACRDMECCYISINQLTDEIDKAIKYCDCLRRAIVNSNNLRDDIPLKSLLDDYIRHFKRLKAYYIDMQDRF